MPQVWRVLVIDSNRYFDENLWQMISPAGVEIVTIARTINEAMAQMTNRRPDLVLVDIADGRTDGLAVIRTLRRRYRRLPIIALTPPTVVAYEEAVRRAGAVACLPKAHLVQQLWPTIERVMSPIPAIAFCRAQTTTYVNLAGRILNQELSQLPQQLIGAGLGLVGGAMGVVLAVTLALVIQISLPPSVVFLPGLIPLMMIALLAGWGASKLLRQGVTRISPHWFRGHREQIWQIASACATGTCLFQVVFFTLR